MAEETAQGYRDVERRLKFTRLGQGVDSRRRLDPEAIRRTIEAVAEFCAVAGELGATRLRVAATSAARDASNGSEFLDAARRLAGAELEILSGEQEAALTFAGATTGLRPGLYLVCDIGGGSTELVLGAPGAPPRRWASIDVGAVRLTERHPTRDPPTDEDLARLEAAADEHLYEVDLPGARDAELVGVAGTITSLAAIRLDLKEYDPALIHGMHLSTGEVERLHRRLAAMPLAERSGIPMLPEGRADIIVAGTAILMRIMSRWGFGEVMVSEKDILDGLVATIDR